MRSRHLALLIAPLLLAACGNERNEPSAGSSADTAAVRVAFDAYRTALHSPDASKAVALIDSGTIVHFGRMRDLALEGDEPSVRALPVLEQVLVLALRHRIPVDTLRTLTPERVVAWTFRPEWTGDVARQQDIILGRIEIDGDEATGEAAGVGETTGQLFFFRKESNGWKIDLARIARANSERVETRLGNEQADREKFISALVEKATGRPAGPGLWKPPSDSGR